MLFRVKRLYIPLSSLLIKYERSEAADYYCHEYHGFTQNETLCEAQSVVLYIKNSVPLPVVHSL